LLIVKASFPWCDKDTLIDLLIQIMIKSMCPDSAEALTAPAPRA